MSQIISLSAGVNTLGNATSEYAGKTFKIWKDGKIGSGVFTEGTVQVILA